MLGIYRIRNTRGRSGDLAALHLQRFKAMDFQLQRHAGCGGVDKKLISHEEGQGDEHGRRSSISGGSEPTRSEFGLSAE